MTNKRAAYRSVVRELRKMQDRVKKAPAQLYLLNDGTIADAYAHDDPRAQGGVIVYEKVSTE